jgi:hypothetical protein
MFFKVFNQSDLNQSTLSQSSTLNQSALNQSALNQSFSVDDQNRSSVNDQGRSSGGSTVVPALPGDRASVPSLPGDNTKASFPSLPNSSSDMSCIARNLSGVSGGSSGSNSGNSNSDPVVYNYGGGFDRNGNGNAICRTRGGSIQIPASLNGSLHLKLIHLYKSYKLIENHCGHYDF